LPASMSSLATPFRLGIGPSGRAPRPGTFAGASVVESEAEDESEAEGEAEAAVMAVVSLAVGGVHFEVVVTAAVAVSFTDLTEAAFDATAILAPRLAGCLAVIEAMLHEAVPSSSAHPLNLGFRLDGCAASATVTSDADPFSVETCTT
jgi:hypothetical protein